MDRPELAEAIAEVRRVIADAGHRAGRSIGEVTLIGASKTVPVSTIEAARAVGLRDFGENYARDLRMKAAAVDATWHFIGALQRGTSATVARHAHVVHAAEPGSGLATLARRMAAGGKTMPCLVEVDFTGLRHGLAPEAVPGFLDEAAGT